MGFTSASSGSGAGGLPPTSSAPESPLLRFRDKMQGNRAADALAAQRALFGGGSGSASDDTYARPFRATTALSGGDGLPELGRTRTPSAGGY